MVQINHYCNLNDIVDYRNEYLPESIAYRFLKNDLDEQILTSSKLYTEVARLSHLLLEHAAPGDRVILAAQPGLEYIISFLACMRIGAIAVPVFPPATPQMAIRLLHIIHDAKPRLILSDKMVISSLKKGLLAHRFLPGRIKRIIGMGEAFTSLFAVFKEMQLPLIAIEQREQYASELPSLNPLGPQDIAFLQYTSGSTGNPKGVILTHGNLLNNMAIMKKATGQNPDSHIFSWLPPYHDMGLIGAILEPLYANVTTTLMSPQDFIEEPLRWVKNMSRFQATITAGPNFAYELCARRATDTLAHGLDLSALCVAVNGAEPVSAKTIDLFYEKFKHSRLRKNALFPSYGLAEATLLVSSKTPLSEDKVIRVQLRALGANQVVLETHSELSLELVSSGTPHMEVRLIDPETKMPCEEHRVGEIWIKGDSIGQGYYHNEEETNKTFKNRINTQEQQTDYLKTGDLGFFHEGHLFICGRIKDVIIINGQNYYPQDFERIVMSSSPHIKQGNVIAFAQRGAITEQLSVVAELKTDTPKALYAGIVNDIQQALSRAFHLSAHKVYLTPQKTIPKTTSGKLQRSKCAELINNNKIKPLYIYQAVAEEIYANEDNLLWINKLLTLSEEDRKTQLLQDIKTTVMQVMHMPDQGKISADLSLFELGIDSLNALHLIDKLNEQLSIDLNLSELFKNHTLDNLVNYLLQKIKVSPSTMAITNLPLTENTVHQDYDCSFIQESILTHYSFNKELGKYNLFTAVLFDQNVSYEEVVNAVEEFIKNNDTLSLRFIRQNNEYKMRYSPILNYDTCIKLIKLNPGETKEQFLQAEVVTPFDLLGGLLFRMVIFQYETGEHAVLLIINHIISDMHSIISAQQEIIHPHPFKEQFTQAKFNTEQRALYSKQEQAKQFNLDGLKTLKLHNSIHHDIDLFAMQQFDLCSKDTMLTLTRLYHTTGFVVCLAVMSLILNAISLNEKIQLLIPLSKRKTHKSNSNQGLFVTNLLLSPHIDWELKFQRFCESIQKELLDSQENYGTIEKELFETGGSQSLNVNLPVLIGYLGDFSTSNQQLLNMGSTSMNLDLMIYYSIDSQSQWKMHLNYIDQQFPSEVIRAIGFCFKSMLQQILFKPNILNRKLYSRFSAETLLHNYSNSLRAPSIAIKTNIAGNTIRDLFHLFFESQLNFSIKITQESGNDSLFLLSNLNEQQLKIVIIDVQAYFNNEEHRDTHELLLLHDHLKLLFIENPQYFIGMVVTPKLLQSTAFKDLLKDLSQLKIKNRIFVQPLELSSQYDLSLGELIQKMAPHIMQNINRSS